MRLVNAMHFLYAISGIRMPGDICMKLLNRLREAMGSRGIGMGDHVACHDEELESSQTEDTSSISTTGFLGDDVYGIRQGERRRIPEIHEDIPPNGLLVLDDDAELDPA